MKPVSNWQPGDVIYGKYELVKLIGAGGMGVVWRIYHREWDRELALKMPLAEIMGNAAMRERLVREAETWIGLGVHPHIVQCWFVQDIGGVPSLFLDFLTGGSLKGWMDQGFVGPGGWKLILEIAMQVAEGMAYAHSRGVVHRDIKPENLLIRGDERVCVTDFGIVKTALPESKRLASELSTTGSTGTGVTGVGGFLGTPQYGAPEQWGAAESVGPAADIYAFGVMLYEMCCGRRPFDVEGEDMRIEELIERHLSKKPADPREFYAEVPQDLAALCLSMLEKKPAARPSSMLALREELSTIYTRITGASYPPPKPLIGTTSPEVLNNQAVSLHSLGKTYQATELLRRALRIESSHPECLYNQIQLEKREGRIDFLEGMRRLKQARAAYPLALLMIEEGLTDGAAIVLQKLISRSEAPGCAYRALGDALMYGSDYAGAQKAYALALELVPKDDAASERRALALAGERENSRGIFFPNPNPRHINRSSAPGLRLLLDDYGNGMIGISPEAVIYLDYETDEMEPEQSRLYEGGPITDVWIAGKRLLIADRKGFEFRLIPSLQELMRREGRVLACSCEVDSVVSLEQNGPHFFQVDKGRFEPILMQGQSPSMGPMLACFDASGQQLCLLLPSGQLAGIDEENRAIVHPWPERIEYHRQARALALTGDGSVVLAYANGLCQCFDVVERRLEFEVGLPGVPVSVEVHCKGQRIVVRSEDGFAILDREGALLLSGRGPITIDSSGEYALLFMERHLMQFQLMPLYPQRRWPRKFSDPKDVRLARSGRVAVTMDANGEYHIWEVDEAHRVYQRDLILSTSRSYHEILSDDESFRQLFAHAEQGFSGGEYQESYRYLQRARKVQGFSQHASVLDLAWKLQDYLAREGLEAVWERWSVDSDAPGLGDFGIESRYLLFFMGHRAYLVVDDKGRMRTIWTFISRNPLRFLSCYYKGSQALVVAADRGGVVSVLSLERGELLKEVLLPTSDLKKARLLADILSFYGGDFCIGQLDLSSGAVRHRNDFKEPVLAMGVAFKDKLFLSTPSSFGSFDLRKKGDPLRGVQMGGNQLTTSPCFIKHLPDEDRLVLGFNEGTLLVLDSVGKRTLAILNHNQESPITGFGFVPNLFLAVSSNARGDMYFWDLLEGRLLDKFLAHRKAITYLRVHPSGRYILSAGEDRVIRLWETSWELGAFKRAAL